jgi:hypothetical protein
MAVAHQQHKAEKHKETSCGLSNQSGISELSLTMPNPAKQLERHTWAAGYADGYIDGLEEAWARINAAIERGPMPQREKDEYRNGLLFACKLIASPNR